MAAAPPVGEGGMGSGASAIFDGSVAVYLAAVGFIHWVKEGKLKDRVIMVRVAAAAAAAAVGLAFLGSALSPPLFAASVALLLLTLTTFETLRAGEASPR